MGGSHRRGHGAGQARELHPHGFSSRTEAAKILGVPRTALVNRVKRYRLA